MTSEHKEEITIESKDDEELESNDLNLDETEWEASPIEMGNLSLTLPPIEPPLSLELKTLPK